MVVALVTGAVGQIGSELVPALRNIYGAENVIATGHRTAPPAELKAGGPFVTVDVANKDQLEEIILKYRVTEIYHLASLLSATSEHNPDLAWHVNVDSLKNVLDLANKHKTRVFWPSSIGAFGPTTPNNNTPQSTVLEPTSMYGVTKVTGELLCNYYFSKYGVDVRSIRFPGIISYKTECVRTSYNLTAFSLTPKEVAQKLKAEMTNFEMSYEIDPVRQKIADSWPDSIDDSIARKDWGWSPAFDVENTAKIMLEKLREKFQDKAV